MKKAGVGGGGISSTFFVIGPWRAGADRRTDATQSRPYPNINTTIDSPIDPLLDALIDAILDSNLSLHQRLVLGPELVAPGGRLMRYAIHATNGA